MQNYISLVTQNIMHSGANCLQCVVYHAIHVVTDHERILECFILLGSV
jgi:hypothetical protein